MVLLDIFSFEYVPLRFKLLSLVLFPISFFSEKCRDFLNYSARLNSITKDLMSDFDKKAEEMKQRIIKDVNISDDDLVQAYEDGLDEVRKSISGDIQNKIQEMVDEIRKKYGDNFPSSIFEYFIKPPK